MVKPVELSLTIYSPDIDNERLDDLTRYLADDLNSLDLEEVWRPQGSLPEEGSKGALSTFGTLMLVTLPAAIPSLIAFLQAWVFSSKNSQVTIKTPAGLEVTFSPENNLSQEDVLALVEKLQTIDQNPEIVAAGSLALNYNRSKMRNLLIKYFDLSELKTLCFDLGVDYEELAGERKGEKVVDLLVTLEREDRISELMEKVNAYRPNAPWHDVKAS